MSAKTATKPETAAAPAPKSAADLKAEEERRRLARIAAYI